MRHAYRLVLVFVVLGALAVPENSFAQIYLQNRTLDNVRFQVRIPCDHLWPNHNLAPGEFVRVNAHAPLHIRVVGTTRAYTIRPGLAYAFRTIDGHFDLWQLRSLPACMVPYEPEVLPPSYQTMWRIGSRRALLIGIEEPWAENGVKNLKELLEEQGYEVKDEFYGVRQRKPGGPAKPADKPPSMLVQDLKTVIPEWVSRTEPNDTMFVAVIGHATRSGLLVDIPGVGKVTTQDFHDLLAGCKARHRLLTLDCCYAGQVESKGAFITLAGSAWWQPGYVPSSDDAERLDDLDPIPRSPLFNRCLVEGLSGAADANRDNWIDTHEICTYVMEQVNIRAKRLTGRTTIQAPVCIPSLIQAREMGITEFPIVKATTDAPEEPFLVEGFTALELAEARNAWSKRLGLPQLKKAMIWDGKDESTKVEMRLILIPPGEFTIGWWYGDEDERPPRKVRITQPFYMGIHEVTQEQYLALGRWSNPSWFDRGKVGPKAYEHPVERVNRKTAFTFCADLSDLDPDLEFRLPTEAEWEYACRAGTTTRFHFGDRIDPEYANYRNMTETTAPVGTSGPANRFGLVDMHGNVAEWCIDSYYGRYNVHRSSFGAPAITDPVVVRPDGDFGRVARGGSWNSDAWDLRASNRQYISGSFSYEIGFRVMGFPKKRDTSPETPREPLPPPASRANAELSALSTMAP